MNIAIVIAAGSGQRMNQHIPKQFMSVNNKPILVYTLESFEKNSNIDLIEVVCLDGWQEFVKSYAKEYGITKLNKIVTGGKTGQESIYQGIKGLNEISKEEDIVVIHDGIRPIVDQFVLDDVIQTCKIHGNAVTSLPYNEQIFVIDDEMTTTKYIRRETLRRVSTPQAYMYKDLIWAYKKAFDENVGIHGSSYTNTLMVDLGVKLYFAKGSDRNIKITTQDDLELFKAILSLEK